MRRPFVYAAALAPCLLVLTSGPTPAAPATAPAKAAPAAGADLKGPPGTPGEALASKGLAKSGTIYVLNAEREVAEGVKALAQAKAKMNDENKSRAKVEKEVNRAKTAFAQFEFERRGYMQKLENAKDAGQQNQLIAKINNLTSQMKEAAQYKEDQEKQLAKIGDDNKTKYINQILDLYEQAEKAQKLYEALAADAEVKTSLDQVKGKLGPTPDFTANMAQLKRLRGGVTSETIEVKMDGGVPMVEVTLNKSFTRSMVLDTGASIIAIPAGLATQMELVPAKDDPTVRLQLADGKIVEAKQTMLKSVRVGSFTIENVECAILPPDLVAAEPLLGGSFLGHFVYKLDPKAGKLHLAQVGPEGKPAATTGDKKPPAK